MTMTRECLPACAAIAALCLLEVLSWSASSSVALGAQPATSDEPQGGTAAAARALRQQYGRSVDNLKLAADFVTVKTRSRDSARPHDVQTPTSLPTSLRRAGGSDLLAGGRRLLGTKRTPESTSRQRTSVHNRGAGSARAHGGTTGGRSPSSASSREGDGQDGASDGALLPSTDPIRLWLSKLNISLPSKSFVVAGINASVEGMHCGDISFLEVESSSPAAPPSFSMSVDGISIGCHGRWSYFSESTPKLLHGKGGISLQVYKASSKIGVKLDRGKNGLAKRCTIDVCGIELNNPTISFPNSGLTGDILKLLTGPITDFVQAALNSIGCDYLKVQAAKEITQSLQAVDAFIVPYLHPPPMVPPAAVGEGVEDLRQSAAAKLVEYGTTGLLGVNMNKIMDTLTEDTGSLKLVAAPRSSLAAVVVPVAKLANLTVAVTGINLSGLNKWGKFSPVSVISQSILQTQIDLEQLRLNVSFTVTVEPAVTHENPVAVMKLVEHGLATVALRRSHLQALTLMELDAAKIDALEPTQFTSLGCALGCVKNMSFLGAHLNFSVDALKVTSVDGNLEADIDDAIDSFIDLWTNSFQAAIPALLDAVVANELLPSANDALATLLGTNMTCAPPTQQRVSSMTGTVLGCACCAAMYVLLFVGLRGFQAVSSNSQLNAFSEQRTLSWNATPITMSTAAPPSRPTERADRFEVQCLGTSPSLPWSVRVLVPLSLLATEALFISANTGIGASVFLTLSVGDDENIELPSLFDFSLVNSVEDMWRAGVYPLSVMIAVFSGFWPHCKLLLLLICWHCPTNWLGTRWSESILRMLDAFGKWSLLDNYVLVMMMIAFRFHIGLASKSEPVALDSAVDVVVAADWGFYGFLIATMLSMVLTHIVLACHRAVSTANDVIAYGSSADLSEPLCSHVFEYNDRRGKRQLVFTACGQVAVTLLLVLSLVLLIVGAVVPAFAFEFRGAAGTALGLLNQTTSVSFSLVSLGQALPAAAAKSDSIGIRAIQATYFAFGLLFPALLLLSLAILWLVPLRAQAQRRLFVCTEVFNAWSAIDVFVLSVFAAILEIRQFAQFIIGDKCDTVNRLIQTADRENQLIDRLLDGDTRCFDAVATLAPGCYWLFAGCAVLITGSGLVMRTSHRAIAERRDWLLASSIAQQVVSINAEQGSGVARHCDDVDVGCEKHCGLGLLASCCPFLVRSMAHVDDAPSAKRQSGAE